MSRFVSSCYLYSQGLNLILVASHGEINPDVDNSCNKDKNNPRMYIIRLLTSANGTHNINKEKNALHTQFEITTALNTLVSHKFLISEMKMNS